MMKAYIDTNVVIDLLTNRPGAELAEDVILTKNITFCITASAVTDIYFIIRRQLSPKAALESIKDMLTVFEVIDTTAHDIKNAISLGWKDFEDAVQYASAVANKIEIIITNNKKDFVKSLIPVVTPGEFLSGDY